MGPPWVDAEENEKNIEEEKTYFGPIWRLVEFIWKTSCFPSKLIQVYLPDSIVRYYPLWHLWDFIENFWKNLWQLLHIRRSTLALCNGIFCIVAKFFMLSSTVAYTDSIHSYFEVSWNICAQTGLECWFFFVVKKKGEKFTARRSIFLYGSRNK